MPCGCNGATPPAEPVFTVRLPNGTTKDVVGEHAAKIEVTIAGGGTYTRK